MANDYGIEVLIDSSISDDLKATLVKRILRTLARSGRSLSLTPGPVYGSIEEQLLGVFNIIFAGGVNWDRVGQRLVITNRTVSKLAFKTYRVGSPTGTITFTIRKHSDDSIIVSKVYGSAGLVPLTADLVEVTFDTPVLINEEVKILMEWSGPLGDINNYLAFHYVVAEAKAGEFAVTYPLLGVYQNISPSDATYRYTYLETTSVNNQSITVT